jgi:hypothetical protein
MAAKGNECVMDISASFGDKNGSLSLYKILESGFRL